jgi:hypothetical protein
MGQHYDIKFTSISSERENTVSEWAFKFNDATVAAKNWHFKGYMIKVNRVVRIWSTTCLRGSDFTN